MLETTTSDVKHKTCIMCKERKSVDEFYNHNKHGSIYKSSYCKICNNERKIENYKKHKLTEQLRPKVVNHTFKDLIRIYKGWPIYKVAYENEINSERNALVTFVTGEKFAEIANILPEITTFEVGRTFWRPEEYDVTLGSIYELIDTFEQSFARLNSGWRVKLTRTGGRKKG